MIIQIALGILLGYILIVFVLPLLGLSIVAIIDKKEVILNFFYKSLLWIFAILVIAMVYSQGPVGEDLVAYGIIFSFIFWIFRPDKNLFKEKPHANPKKLNKDEILKSEEMKIWESKMLRIFYILLTITFLALGIGILAEKTF